MSDRSEKRLGCHTKSHTDLNDCVLVGEWRPHAVTPTDKKRMSRPKINDSKIPPRDVKVSTPFDQTRRKKTQIDVVSLLSVSKSLFGRTKARVRTTHARPRESVLRSGGSHLPSLLLYGRSPGRTSKRARTVHVPCHRPRGTSSKGVDPVHPRPLVYPTEGNTSETRRSRNLSVPTEGLLESETRDLVSGKVQKMELSCSG